MDIVMARGRSDPRPIAVGVLGCLLALLCGAAAASGHGLLIAGAIAALSVCVTAAVIYARDPVLALIWLWLFEVFNAPLSAAAGYYSSAGQAIRQGDEALVLLLVVLTLLRSSRAGTRLAPLRFILPAIGVAIFGILGALCHQVPLTVTLVGLWLGLKLWIMVGVTLMLPWKLSDAKRVYVVITRVGIVVAVLGFGDYLTHSAISHALHTSIYRFGVEASRAEAVHSIFPHPGEYSLFMSLLFAVSLTRFVVNRNRSDLALAVLFACSVLLSLRLKGFLSLVAVAAIIGLAQGMGRKGGIAVLVVGAIIVAGAYGMEGNVISKQISTYASSETSVRARLYSVGERIGIDDFPLGVGFGRFASYPSRLFYSPVYYRYGLSSVWGLSRSFPNFIDDTSWPSVIGETGFGGFVLFLLGLSLLTVAVVRRLRASTAATRWMPLAALCTVAVVLIDSLGNPTLFDWLAVTTFAMILGPVMALRVKPPRAASTDSLGLTRLSASGIGK